MHIERWEQASHDAGDLRREMQEGHGGRLVNMLVGLIINANDGYERAGMLTGRKIQIEVDRTKKKQVRDRQGSARIRVADWGQGMDYNDFGNFAAYGGAKSQWASGVNVAGLFGREASDIMWSNVGSRYVSIKNHKGYVCEFRPQVEFRRRQLDRRVTRQYQEEFNTGQGNFTLAEFHVDEDYHLPQYDHLVDDLKNHFRLRLLNSDPSVEIWLHYVDSHGRRKPQRITFTPFEQADGGADLLAQDKFELKYKDYPAFQAEGQLYRRHGGDLSQNGPERQGGILVYADDRTVLELSLFSFDDSTHAAYTGHLFGYLKLNVAAILREELRTATQRAALIEVDRSQLKRRTEFYEMLKAQVDSWLKPWIDSERDRSAQSRAVEVTSVWNRRLRPLFAEINRVMNQKTGQSAALVKSSGGAPPETMEFARERALMSAGTVYRAELLCNAEAVPPGTPVTLSSTNPLILVEPSRHIVPSPSHRSFKNVSVMMIRISAEREGEQGIVTATASTGISASIVIESIEPDVYYPHDGIEWWPDTFQLIEGTTGHPTLWIDLARVTDRGAIVVSSPSQDVEIIDSQIVPSAVRILKDDASAGIRIGRIRPRFRTQAAHRLGTLRAAYESFRDDLAFEVVQPRDVTASGNWTFNGIEFEEGPQEMDVYTAPEGKVCLNLQHPLVASYFGATSDEAVNRVKTDAGARQLAAHMVVDCILHELSRKAWRNEDGPNANVEIGTRSPSSMDYQVYNYVMRLKGQYGVRWVALLTDVLGSQTGTHLPGTRGRRAGRPSGRSMQFKKGAGDVRPEKTSRDRAQIPMAFGSS